MDLEELIERHEGYRRLPYKDSLGILTIGIGRNLEAVGISRKEARFLMREDIARVRKELRRLVPAFENLNSAREAVLVSMAFNLGVSGLLKFKRMLAALERSDWIETAREMLESRWAEQVGNRAEELAVMMRLGEWSAAAGED